MTATMQQSRLACSDQVRDVHGHLLDLRVVVLLDVLHGTHVIVCHEVDRDALPAKSAAAPNAVQVVLHVLGEVEVDHQGHLLHIETPAPEVGGDQDPARARAELLHNGVALLLRHVTVDGRHSEVRIAHLLCQPVNLLLRVAEDHRLSDGESVVEVAQRVELPLLAFHCHEELLDALERQLIALHKHTEGVIHELMGHLEDLVRHGRGD
mmetsp:Transcript_17230/g.37925  ORF Transcript_17230/g.37925 Transcript_17230/m.37925 type:complete len:209 (+) Transcript_17230:89-715(+)